MKNNAETESCLWKPDERHVRSRVVRYAVFLVLALWSGAMPICAGVLKIELPPETLSFNPAPGAEIANGQCLTCHSVDYVVTQPPESRVFWLAEVKKMKKVYGAQIPDDQVEPLADYLAQNYGVETNIQPAVAPAVNPQTAPAVTPAMDVEAFAKKFGCLSCHGVNVKIVGPAFKDVAAKYHNDPEAFDKIAEQIHHGGSGKWGPVIMPPFPMVTDAQAKTLAAWILSQDASPH